MKRLAALLIVLSAVGHSQDAHVTAIQHIAQATVFAFGGIGFAGTISDGEKDYWVIRHQPIVDALASFEKLYLTGNPQAKSYALVGIRRINGERFKEIFQSLKDSKEEVTTEEG